MKLYVEIGLRVRKAREAAGLKQAQIASMMELSRSSYINIEYGRQRVSLDKLIKISEITGFELEYFFTGVESGRDNPYVQTFKLSPELHQKIDDIPESIVRKMLTLIRYIKNN